LRVTWSTPAADDLRLWTAIYRQIDPDLSARTRLRVSATTAALRKYGNIGTPLGDGLTHKKLVKGTSLLLFFTVEKDEIRITRLRHVRENWHQEY
jgi:plasmid stabilization system protein ParE